MVGMPQRDASSSYPLTLGEEPAHVGLAWLLAHSPVMTPIPGTSQVSHLEDNIAAASLTLSPEDQKTLD